MLTNPASKPIPKFKYNYEQAGHICCYGGTGTGKTYYLMHVIEDMIETRYCKRSDVIIFAPNPSQFSGFEVHTEWKDITKVIEKRRALPKVDGKPQRTVLFLDDMNSAIDTINDKKYVELFTQGRHWGFKILTVAHKPTSIGVDARACLSYAITSFNSNISYIAELAKFYYMGDHTRLMDAIKTSKQMGDHVMIVIDKTNGKLHVDRAPDINKIMDDEIDIKNTGSSDSDGAINAGVNKSVVNNGLYNDNSTINIQNNMEIKQLIQKHKFNSAIRNSLFWEDQEYKAREEKIECRDLCLKLMKPREDIIKQMYLLNKYCGVSCVNLKNLEKWSGVFMNHFYPDHAYNPDNRVRTLTNGYHLVDDAHRLLSGDTSSTGLLVGYASNYMDKSFLRNLGF